MQDIVITRPDPSSLVAEASPFVDRAKAIVVTNTEEHSAALESIKALRGFEKKITEHFEPARKAFDTAKKELLLARDRLIAPIYNARVVIDKTCLGYETEQRRIADAETERLQAEARKQEEERRLNEAVEAENAGDAELADQLLDEPAPTPVVYVAPALAKVEGMSTQVRWGHEVVEFAALVCYIAGVKTLSRPEDLTLLQPNAVNLNRRAVEQRGELRIPGVRAVSSTHRVARGA